MRSPYMIMNPTRIYSFVVSFAVSFVCLVFRYITVLIYMSPTCISLVTYMVKKGFTFHSTIS